MHLKRFKTSSLIDSWLIVCRYSRLVMMEMSTTRPLPSRIDVPANNAAKLDIFMEAFLTYLNNCFISKHFRRAVQNRGCNYVIWNKDTAINFNNRNVVGNQTKTLNVVCN